MLPVRGKRQGESNLQEQGREEGYYGTSLTGRGKRKVKLLPQ